MKLYISEESQYMYSETLRNEEIVNYIGPEVLEDEEEPDNDKQLPDEDEQDKEDTISDNEEEKTEKNNDTQGFEIIVIIIAISIVLLLIKKKSY